MRLKSMTVIKIFLDPIVFVINVIYKIETSILNVLGAVVDLILKISNGIKNNCIDFFKLLFHTDSYYWKKTITILGTSAASPIHGFINKAKEFEKDFDKKRRIQKDIKNIRKAILTTKTLALNSALLYLVRIGTLFLQIVSFVTTYQGIDYYFGDIFKYSTLLITFVVQGSLLVLANAAVNKQRFTKSRFIMLVLFMMISITFSYTGLMNSHITPEEEYKNNYKDFYQSYQQLYEKIALDSNFSEEFNILQITNKIDNLINFSNDQIGQLDNQLLEKEENLYYVNFSEDEDREERSRTIQEELNEINGLKTTLNNYSEALSIAKINVPNINENDADIDILKKMNDNSYTNYADVKMKYDNLHNYLKTMIKNLNMGELSSNLGEVYQKYANGVKIHKNVSV